MMLRLLALPIRRAASWGLATACTRRFVTSCSGTRRIHAKGRPTTVRARALSGLPRTRPRTLATEMFCRVSEPGARTARLFTHSERFRSATTRCSTVRCSGVRMLAISSDFDAIARFRLPRFKAGVVVPGMVDPGLIARFRISWRTSIWLMG